MNTPDFVIIGTGIGGATIAHCLAPTGAKILILERGEFLQDRPEARDARAIFHRGFYKSSETWLDRAGTAFSPGNYYNVGGNSKFYGAVMYRYRESDFAARDLPGGQTIAWPFDYDELEHWYGKAEALYGVRGSDTGDASAPPRSTPYPHPPVPYEPQLEDTAARLVKVGLSPAPLPLSVNHEKWLARAQTPWDAFPDTHTGKTDAETGPLDKALAHDNVTLLTGARVSRLEVSPDGARIEAVHYSHQGEEKVARAAKVILAAGAVNSAILLQRSEHPTRDGGLANSSGAVGRNFMNHNTTAIISYDLRKAWDTVHSKVFGINDFYLNDAETQLPLGNIQQLGKVSGVIMAAQLPVRLPETVLHWFARRAVDWYAMSEDVPSWNSRVYPKGDKIVLDWQPTNLEAHRLLVKRFRAILRKAGFQVTLSKPFGNKAPSHQCGTVMMGKDPNKFPLDENCRAYDHENLWVMDASFLPSSAAVNPSLTIAAQALRVGAGLAADH